MQSIKIYIATAIVTMLVRPSQAQINVDLSTQSGSLSGAEGFSVVAGIIDPSESEPRTFIPGSDIVFSTADIPSGLNNGIDISVAVAGVRGQYRGRDIFDYQVPTEAFVQVAGGFVGFDDAPRENKDIVNDGKTAVHGGEILLLTNVPKFQSFDDDQTVFGDIRLNVTPDDSGLVRAQAYLHQTPVGATSPIFTVSGSMFVEGAFSATHTVTLPEHIIVVNHGWQPTGAFETDSIYMPDVVSAVTDELVSGIDSGEILVIAPAWQEAFSLDYNGAYRGTESAADRLADQIQEITSFGDLFVSGYDPSLHIVGHSLGTVVTAHAVSKLDRRGIDVDMVTLLDTPLRSSVSVNFDGAPINSLKAKLASFDDALLFWKLMPKGSVDYVENFYATDRTVNLFDDPTSFGQPIAGTGPCIDGACVGGGVATGHVGIHEEFYANHVGNPGWKTPALNSSYDIAWNPTGLEERYFQLIDQLTDVQASLRANTVDFLGLRASAIEEWQLFLGQAETREDGSVRLMRDDNFGLLRSNRASEDSLDEDSYDPPDVLLSAEVDFSDLIVVEFEYSGNDPEASLALYYSDIDGDILLWEAMSIGAGNQRAVVLTTDIFPVHFGFSRLNWEYNSSNVFGSYVELSNLKITTVEQVPEPSSLALLSVAVLSGLRRRRTYGSAQYR